MMSPWQFSRSLLTGLAALSLLTALQADQQPPAEERAGGNTTVYASGRNAFSFPAANLSEPERTRFVIGNSFFRRNWVEAPASTRARDGLGPHFIARSCGGCHLNDGRGAPPSANQQPVELLLRLSIPGSDAHGGPAPDPIYGGQFSNAAISGVKPEGQARIRYQLLHGRFADGSRYQLQKPEYSLTGLNYGPAADGLMISPRVAPQVIGMGLLEAIREADILQNAKDHAAKGGPIRGLANYVWDEPSQSKRLGRFGWKANVASVAHQTASAFRDDMGITSRLFPGESCTPKQVDCLQAPRGAEGTQPEIDDTTFDNVVFYTATLAPPAARNLSDPQVARGQALFQSAQCASCHRPSYVTGPVAPGPHSSAALGEQTIWPYTDLLLHDMGDGLADNRPDFLANGRQWRTPPLWGIGLIKDVNGHTRLLHDGRARGVMEAILWHGGEAEASKQAVLKMRKAERDALVKFVESR